MNDKTVINKNPIARYVKNPTSLRLAIDAHCYVCMGGSEGDLTTLKSVVSEIRACRSNVCSLRLVRSLKPSSEGVYEY